MADHAYAIQMSAYFQGTHDLATATIKLCLVNIAAGHYTPNFITDQFLSAIASGDRIAFSAALTGVTVTQASGPSSIFNASNTVFSSVSGSAGGALVLFIDTGNPATSPLLAYFDSYSGLPVTPAGADINVAFNGSGIQVMNG